MAPSIETNKAAPAVIRKAQDPQHPEQVEINGHIFNKEAPVPKADAKNMDINSGDHGLERQSNRKDFIWTLSGEPHAIRRKQMMKEYGKEIQQLTGHEPLTKYIVAVLLAIHIGIGIYIRDEALYGGTLKFWAVVYVFGASLAQILFLANHEVSHNLAFKKQVHNKIFGIVANGPMLVPYFISFKEYHNEHHKEQGTDGIDTDLPTEFEARLLSSVPGKLLFCFFNTWIYAGRPVFVKPQAFTLWHLYNVLFQVAFIGGMVHYFGWGPIFYFLGSAHFAGSWHPLASHFIAEHYTFVGEAETASYYGPLNYLTWNVGFHNEHHDFPYIAWSNLPKLRKLASKYYDNVPYHKSWTGALWDFIFNEDITIYNRVKRQGKKAN